MDPISQGALGASFAQARSTQSDFKWATIVGMVSGLSPDLDVFIRSETNPMIAWEYHRHFTHSLFFVPFGALICALLCRLFLRKKSFKKIYLYCFMGYLSHALLDCCTAYGTLWFWPFSNIRVAWNTVSIIDPLWTFPLIFFVFLAYFKKSSYWARVGVAIATAYLILGFVQKKRVESLVVARASSRGHKIERIHVGPSFGNIILWRGMYEFEGYYYTDAYHSLIETRVIEGASIKKANLELQDLKGLGENSLQYQDLKTFSWFAMGFLAWHPEYENVIVDARYSTLPNSSIGIWGVKINPLEPNSHITRISMRESRKLALAEFWNMLINPDSDVSSE